MLKSLAAIAIAMGGLLVIQAADPQRGLLNETDQAFVKHAAANGGVAAKVAELGAQKAEKAEVKEIAQHIIADHTAANAELAAVANLKGVPISAVIEPRGANAFQGLERVKGDDFDRSFIDQMRRDHKKMIGALEDEAKKVKDTELKAWVDKTLPTMKSLLDRIENIFAKLPAPPTSNDGVLPPN